jgi:hypothetical protein
MDEIGRLYAENWRGDCVGQSMLALWAAGYDLRNGPPIVTERSEHWCEAAITALRQLASSPPFKAAVLKAAYRNRGIPVPEGIEPVDPNWEAVLFWSERQGDLVKVFDRLRRFICEQTDCDPLELCLFDQLRKNADGEIFRGETFQIVRGPLLKSLRREFPAMNWNTTLLNVTIDKLCRHMEKNRIELTKEGFLLSNNNSRPKNSSKETINNQTLSGKEEADR